MNDSHHSSLDIHASADQHGLELPARARVWRRSRRVLLVVVLVLAAGAARTIVANSRNAQRLNEITAQNARQHVTVVHPRPAADGGRLSLPGTLRGYIEAPIYSRASGYVLRWHADIGAHVQQGQLLAELDTPEIDQELQQAIAQRQQAASTLALAQTSFDRARQLRERDAVSQQELDDRQGAYNQDVANLAAAQANVGRLTQLKSFQRIVAPITGVITQRNVDVGDLVNAGNSGSGQALFTIAQTDRLRLYMQVPQAYAQQVALGQHVRVTQAELPNVDFAGTVTRTSQAIDVTTRSLQVEITLPNGDGKLMPGAYVEVALQTDAAGTLSVPANTLLFRAEGPRVAVVDAQGKVRLRAVTIAHDLGQVLEISTGLATTDRVIVNPADSLADGDLVTAQAAPESSATAPHGASATADARHAKGSTT